MLYKTKFEEMKKENESLKQRVKKLESELKTMIEMWSNVVRHSNTQTPKGMETKETEHKLKVFKG